MLTFSQMIVNKNSPFTFGNENDTTEVGTSVLTLKFSTPGTKDEIKVTNSSKPMTIKVQGKIMNFFANYRINTFFSKTLGSTTFWSLFVYDPYIICSI